MIVTTYNQHVRLLSSEPFGWFAPPKFTRAWEPTLLWNHYGGGGGVQFVNPIVRRLVGLFCLGLVFWFSFHVVNSLILYDNWGAAFRFGVFLGFMSAFFALFV